MPKKAQSAPYRKADLNNLPLQEARKRFLDEFGKHSHVLQTLFGVPLEIWESLPAAAKELCRYRGWVEILNSPIYGDFDPAITAGDAKLYEEQRIHLEMLPLRDSLNALARTFGLMHKDEPALWAMDAAVETLHQAGIRPPEKRVLQWYQAITGMSEAYPALTEPGVWMDMNGEPEKELFTIMVEIGPKQPTETFEAFGRRFDRICAKERERYIRALKAAEWLAVRRSEKLKWIDRLAKWQAGLKQSEIDLSVKTASQRAAFSQGIKRAATEIQLTLRKSKHDPKRRPEH